VFFHLFPKFVEKGEDEFWNAENDKFVASNSVQKVRSKIYILKYAMLWN
jgi:hypothetical protein